MWHSVICVMEGASLGLRWKALKVSIDLAKSEGISFMFVLKARTC